MSFRTPKPAVPHKTRHGIVPEGTTSHSAFILQSGWACCYKHSREGGRQITSFPLPGDFMGLGSILLRSSHHSFAALSDIVVSSFSFSSMMLLFEKFPRIAAAILWAASRDEAMLIEHLVSVGRRSAVERVAHCLLELRQRLQLVGLASETEFQCPVTQCDLADALGLSPIHVNRVLRQLREQDLLTLKSHTAIFHNIAGLIRFSGYDNGYLDHAALECVPRHDFMISQITSRTSVRRTPARRTRHCVVVAIE